MFDSVNYEQMVDYILNNIESYAIDEEEIKLIEQELLKANKKEEEIIRTLERVDFPNSSKRKISTR